MKESISINIKKLTDPDKRKLLGELFWGQDDQSKDYDGILMVGIAKEKVEEILGRIQFQGNAFIVED